MRLVGIQLRDFRAFPGEFKLELKDGCNLLLHGENGSGKSSLALALREFFTLERPFPRPIEPYANIFADKDKCQPLVQLTFSNKPVNEVIKWSSAECHPLELDSGSGKPNSATVEQRQTLRAVSRCSGFFGYRSLLRASLSLKPDDLPRQLFLLFVEDLLSGFQAKVHGSEKSLGELWLELKETKPKSRRDRDIALADSVAESLDSAFRPFLDQLTGKANDYLQIYFRDCRMKVSFDYPGSSFAKKTKRLTGTAVHPIIEFNGNKVGNHHEFLNEARLTALALSVFLAAVKLADSDPANPDPLRLLVLDDVLIGLDLNNRLPLLELLRCEFPNYQIILLTHDLVWFEIAREHTSNWGTWTYARLFEEVTNSKEPSYPRLKNNVGDLEVAGQYLHAGDLRAAAVYIRAAFETKMKKLCQGHHIQIGYQENPKHVSANALWQGILGHHKALPKNKQDEFLDPTLIARIEAVRSAVLNRLSHSGASSLTRTEVAAALQAIIDFGKCRNSPKRDDAGANDN